MKPDEFLNKLNKLAEESRGSFSATVLSLSKVSAAEAVRPLLKDRNFAVKVNALKAIRKYQLTIYEREVMESLLDESLEVQVAAIKTLASFGDFRHYKLILAFYNEHQNARALVIDSFTNYSDNEEVYPFILSQITSNDDKVKAVVIDWFQKAIAHNVLLPWVVSAYKEVHFEAKRLFETIFVDSLPKLFNDREVGNRFKLVYLITKAKT